MELETSIQWRALLDLVEILQARDNRILVVVGPLNEHMLAPEGLEAYRVILREVERKSLEEGVPYVAPQALPSEPYADLCHPLAEGYALLAERLWTPSVE